MDTELPELRLAEADWLIAEARKQIAAHRASLEAMEEALRLMLAQRELLARIIDGSSYVGKGSKPT